MESEPFKITLKDKNDALKLGKDFAKELGKAVCYYWSVTSFPSLLPLLCPSSLQ